MSQEAGLSVKVKIERLVAASITGHALDNETANWLAERDSVMLDKLAAVGLVERRQDAEQSTLKAFMESYVAKRSDVKPGTAIVYGHTQRCLIEFFGADKPLREITLGEADDWRLFLLTDQKLAENTIRRRCGIAKQFFRAAQRRGLIETNPFAELKAGVQANASRFYFISREEARKVLDACPNGQWRLLFALSRYGGLRCPSEHLALRWGDIDWENERMTVHSPKTAHHEGKESRVIPLFPELRPYLDAAYDAAPPRSEFVIEMRRDAKTNLRTTFQKIIKRAGLTPWPKLFQNLRSTRETELAETFPVHVVCAWLGNSQPVAAKHYLQVTDEHFQRGAQCGALEAQNQAQQAGEGECMAGSTAHPSGKKTGIFPEEISNPQADSPPCTEEVVNLKTKPVSGIGLEPTTSTMSTLRSNQLS